MKHRILVVYVIKGELNNNNFINKKNSTLIMEPLLVFLPFCVHSHIYIIKQLFSLYVIKKKYNFKMDFFLVRTWWDKGFF